MTIWRLLAGGKRSRERHGIRMRDSVKRDKEVTEVAEEDAMDFMADEDNNNNKSIYIAPDQSRLLTTQAFYIV